MKLSKNNKHKETQNETSNVTMKTKQKMKSTDKHKEELAI